MEKLLTIKETAKLLDIHWQTVRKYIKEGKLNAIKIGKNVRIKQSDINKLINNSNKSITNTEIERKYIIPSRKAIVQKLLDLEAPVTYHAHVIDHYFVPNKLRNLEEQDKWFKSKDGFALRIRETDNDYSGNITTELIVKKITAAEDHGIHQEVEMPTQDYSSAKDLFELMGLKENVIVDKDRVVYTVGDIKVCIDEIKDAGIGVELEYRGKMNEKKALSEIKKLADILSLSENDISEKGISYIPFLNARF
jgi:predicted adenylyl cyclase CyaB